MEYMHMCRVQALVRHQISSKTWLCFQPSTVHAKQQLLFKWSQPCTAATGSPFKAGCTAHSQMFTVAVVAEVRP